MNSELVTFRVFHDDETLAFFKKFLEKENIPFIVENNSQRFDPSFAYNSFNKDYSVKIAAENFSKVYVKEQKLVEAEIQNAPTDYHLFSFTTVELQEIVNARDEWNAYDYLLAKKILKDRGISLEDHNSDEVLKDRITELKKIENIQPIWLIIFYIIAFLGGFMAILIGYYIKVSKITLPNGEIISKYTKTDILHGNILFFAGIFFLIFWIMRGFYFFPFLHFSY